MADVVQKWSEEKIPQYEQMIRVGLFTEDEIRSIIKKTTTLEYKLVRKMKVKEDYLSYIQYNIHLLSLITKRRKRINYFFKKDEIEYAIVSRIHRTFKHCTYRWPEDLKLWSSHIEFCKVWKKKIQLSKIWTSMLQFHGNQNIDLWLMAATWEYEDNHSADNARQIFLRGIRHFPDDPKLWQEYFQMELIHVMKTRQRMAVLKDNDQPEDTDEEYLKGQAAAIVYKNAIETLEKKSDIKCRFLDIAVRFACFAGGVINMIIQDIFQQHENDALARSTLAQLHLCPPMIKMSQNDSSNVTRAADMWMAEKRVWEDFEVALEELNSAEIWHEYLVFLSGRVACCDISGDQITLDSTPVGGHMYTNERRAKLTSVFEKGHKLKVLNAECYLVYIKYLVSIEEHDKVIELVEECSQFLKCKSIKLKLLELASKNAGVNQEFVKEAVNELLECIPEMTNGEEICFWESWARYAETRKSEDLLWCGLKSAKRHNVAHAAKFAVPILDLLCSRDVDAGFDVYKNRLLLACPDSMKLFDEMLRQLYDVSPINTSKVQACFECSMDNFGKCSPDFWLRYISFAMKYEKSKVASLHWKAMKTLNAELVAKFSEGYALLQIEQSKS